MKNILIGALLAPSFVTQADKNINYNYLEIGYGYININGALNADGAFMNGGFELTEKTYLKGYYDRKNTGRFNFDRYGLSFGLHTDVSKSTDFYSELILGRFDTVLDGSMLIYGLNIGTRAAVNPQFELISKIGYTQIDPINDGYFEVELKGLFILSKNHAISAGLQNFDGNAFDNNIGATLGFRFNF